MFTTLWIFFGITFFAMYLGTITSVMTKNLQDKPQFEVEGKKVRMFFAQCHKYQENRETLDIIFK